MSANDQEEEHQVETGLPVVTQSAKSSEEKPSLNMKNWLNLLFYIFNVVFTFGVGSLGWFSGQTNGELSLKYQVCTACECNLSFYTFLVLPFPIIDSRDTKVYCLCHLECHFHLSVPLLRSSTLA
jgi:hypothetical protein